MKTKTFLSSVMTLAWQLVKKNGYTMSEAMKVAWLNAKLKFQMKTRIVKFYFQKVDGSIREAYGTLDEHVMPTTAGTDKRAKNDTVQVYFDTERSNHSIFRYDNFIGCFSADKIKMSVRK